MKTMLCLFSFLLLVSCNNDLGKELSSNSVILTGCSNLKFVTGLWNAWIVEGCGKKFCCANKCTGGFSNTCWNECKLCPAN